MKFVGFCYLIVIWIVKGFFCVFFFEGNIRFLIRVEIFLEFLSLISFEFDCFD